ncbi:MAG: hypothetical protein ACW98D_18055 [Promethearchaeota archaeon]|jgi:SAM-dependent methyltransferase
MPEFEINLEDFLKVFVSNATFEQNIINYIGQNRINLYAPIVVSDKLLCEGIRSVSLCKEIFNIIPDNFKGESVLDLRSNTGYILLDIKKHRNPGRCDGIDINPNNNLVSNSITYYENLNNIAFNTSGIPEIIDKIKKEEIIRFDNILCFGVFTFDDEKLISDVIDCANKKVIFEILNPTNNHKNQTELLDYSRKFLQYGKVESHIMNYQDNLIVEIEVKEKEIPIKVSLDD